ncbi:hypothetical protein SAMN05720471_101252 [Fibrobacter sp. UWP2]|nr:hypothetical protein SAMN05720471_101252 [Fibrobacter sp. UWP2]
MAAVFTVGFIVLVLVCGYFSFNDDDDRNDTWRGL